MKTSIALCTYNGELFLAQQLESILAQTKLPDELLVCDDASTDATLNILGKFAQKAPFEVRIFQNSEQLGVVKNFEKCISLCQHELVFLADQDDYWLAPKIEIMCRFMSNNQNCSVLFSDAELVDDSLNLLGKQLWNEVRFRATQRKHWQQGFSTEILAEGNRVTGCTMAIYRDFTLKLMPFPVDLQGFIHDAWLAWGASLQGKIAYISQPLVWYRQHAFQQVGTRKAISPPPTTWLNRLAGRRKNKIIFLDNQIGWFESLEKYSEKIPDKNIRQLQQFKAKIAFLYTRKTLPANKILRIIPVAGLLLAGKYNRYADADANAIAPYLTALADILE